VVIESSKVGLGIERICFSIVINEAAVALSRFVSKIVSKYFQCRPHVSHGPGATREARQALHKLMTTTVRQGAAQVLRLLLFLYPYRTKLHWQNLSRGRKLA
jgi:hypothetical protein